MNIHQGAAGFSPNTQTAVNKAHKRNVIHIAGARSTLSWKKNAINTKAANDKQRRRRLKPKLRGNNNKQKANVSGGKKGNRKNRVKSGEIRGRANEERPGEE